jgi:hypothetical protein
MEIKLNDDEIRSILAEEIGKRTDFKYQPDPEECWFEVKTGIINGEDVDDIHDVKFCFKEQSK